MQRRKALPVFSLLALLVALGAFGEKKQQRRVEDTTPTPCKKIYSEDLIQTAVDSHLKHINGGHETPHLLLLMGGSGSGKTTFMSYIEKHGFNASEFVFHGLDEYLQYLPEYIQTVSDPDVVYKNTADECYGGGAIPIAKAAQETIVQGRLHTIYEETGKDLKRILKRVLPPFETARYRITTVLINNYEEIAIARAAGRFQESGRYAPDDYVKGTFKDNLKNYQELLGTGRIHEAVYCDNSCMVQGSSLKDASEKRNCLKCWRDLPSPNEAKDDAFLIPEGSLLSGPPQYLQPLLKSEKYEM